MYHDRRTVKDPASYEKTFRDVQLAGAGSKRHGRGAGNHPRIITRHPSPPTPTATSQLKAFEGPGYAPSVGPKGKQSGKRPIAARGMYVCLTVGGHVLVEGIAAQHLVASPTLGVAEVSELVHEGVTERVLVQRVRGPDPRRIHGQQRKAQPQGASKPRLLARTRRIRERTRERETIAIITYAVWSLVVVEAMGTVSPNIKYHHSKR